LFLRCLLLLCLLLLQPVQVFAYSYGDPNKEELAELFKIINSNLQSSPENWNGAAQAFASKRSEIALEFGESTAKTVEQNLSLKQKELVLHNYKAILVMNVDRRLSYAQKQFDDYAKAKLLLAKGRGTFNVLEPYVNKSTATNVYAAFDKALAALGNPGLFGVGTVPANKAEFVKQTNAITNMLGPLFSLKKGTQGASGAAKPVAPKASTPKAVQPTTQANSKKSGNTSTVQTPSTVTVQPAKPALAGAAENKTNPVNSTTAAAATTSTNAAQTTAATTTKAGEPKSAATQTPAESASASTASSTAQVSAEQAVSHQNQSAAPAASKVNPLVTAGVIGGLVLVLGSAFWIGKRKGLI